MLTILWRCPPTCPDGTRGIRSLMRVWQALLSRLVRNGVSRVFRTPRMAAYTGFGSCLRDRGIIPTHLLIAKDCRARLSLENFTRELADGVVPFGWIRKIAGILSGRARERITSLTAPLRIG